ncbi:hypothetical protein D3C84_961020 [compost metagenome]
MQGRQLAAEGVPVLYREHNIVIGAEVENWGASGLEHVQHSFHRKHRVLRCIAQLLGSPLNRYFRAAVLCARRKSRPGLFGGSTTVI